METPDFGSLEPEFQEPYGMYNLEPTKRNASAMLKALEPTISMGVRSNVGTSVGASTRTHAKRLALQAVKTYDPKQAKLGTHVINNLKGLRRVTRKQQQVFRVPERVELDRRFLHNQAAEFEEKRGREPTSQELADFARIPLKRIEYVRTYRAPLSSGQAQTRIDTGGETSGSSPAVKSMAAHNAWIDTVYADMNPTNQLIMELTLGLHGKRAISNQAIAARLKLTPGAVSQRKFLIQQSLDQESELSPF